MATKVGVHAAKTHLSRLLREVKAGKEFEIVNRGETVARLVPPQRERELGIDEGRVVVPDDFNEPLPEDVLNAFER